MKSNRMIYTSLVMACLGVAVTLCQAAEFLDSNAHMQWNTYKQTFGKTYLDEQEHSMRFEMFKKSLAKINKHNQGHSNKLASFSLGLNHMSDWTPSELSKLNGLKATPDRNKLAVVTPKMTELLKKWSELPLPESVDWSKDKSRVGPVRDQGQCGSCWAFATVGMLEGQDFVNSTGGVRQLSPQNLVDCDKQDGGCEGGLLDTAIRYVIGRHRGQENGLEDEKDYPYVSGKTKKQGRCKFNPRKADNATKNLLEPSDLPDSDEHSLQLAVAHYGPVAVGIEATDNLVQYESGVFEDEACAGNTNHGVLVVGYGKSEDGQLFWKIKNSWADSWGEDGYFHMARGKGMCGIGGMSTLALVA